MTRILIRARQIGSWLGGARWDVLVVRSPGTPAAGIVMLEDGPSTNDAATAGPIEALLQGSAMLGNPEDLLAARRGGDWLLAIQGAPPQAGWAQQYDSAGQPAPGRRFEPAGLATWESREMLDALVSLARVTGERRYCRAVGPAVRWFLEAALAPGCWARLYAPGANAPLFVDRDGRRVATPGEARQSYRWTGDFGIPRLLATLGLGSDGRRLAPAAPRPPVRLIGDSGACPGAPPIEAAPDDENPRRRIVRAAVLLQRLEPGPASPCADEVPGK